ncbi:ABC transporter ATP-binding protein [Shewanella sp. 1_MG-2023]|uniref:ABC transporter ATP-binding protein n=1 Tax=unclassified Shewanella TaxID=196818 RepID=UPI0026E277B6|nr:MULTISPECIES: ABC transporter ATP-binding protein [unclassified Shewanella]MDO6610428.1 ABC transporter ATP-binding protein [Shewanella sp. 7_MG-2023]MDO6770553.1 ABC transporter ATP-binding protein [Shewanella sp. 2_MG-2023]MDO6794440.1 ABC transporter ATP-binding protein [Shewanella sp. 1_MG-2023]
MSVDIPSALNVELLSWSADDNQILSRVSFSQNQGEMLGLIGPNGAGKSSLLRCLYRYITPEQGNVKLFGRNINGFSQKQLATQVAVVQQETPHYFEMTTEQIVAMGLTPHKGLFESDSLSDKQDIADALTKVGLQLKAKQQYEQLSGGEKQRALIARAIVQKPQLLILDEPTNHLDIRYQIQILELVRQLGISVIASIHDLNLASAVCDRLILLNAGKCIAQGLPDEVLTEAIIGDVFGVCCQVSKHPQHGKPLITYFYGYQSGGHSKDDEAEASL